MPSPRRVLRRALGITAIVLLLSVQSASAFSQKLTDSGQRDFAYGPTVATSGGQGSHGQSESKLFYTGNGVTERIRWWAVLGTSGDATTSKGVYLWRLVNHGWVKILRFRRANPWAKADTLLRRSVLYVSLRDDKGSTDTNPRQSLLYKVPYLGRGAWGTPSAPTVITTEGPGQLTIARDSLGRLWTAYTYRGAVRVGFTAPGGTAFTISSLPVGAVTSDDEAAITSFGSNQIGVMWSDQNSKRFRFAKRSDGEAIGTWHIKTAYGAGVGGCPTATSDLCANNHINIKTYGKQVYVAIKTSLNDAPNPNPDDPIVVLLRRSASGTWNAFTVSTVGVNGSRPIVVLSPSTDRIYAFARKNTAPGVRAWESSFSSPSFDPTASTAWTANGIDNFDDATSTKRLVTAASGVVVVTSRASQFDYWHNEFLPQA